MIGPAGLGGVGTVTPPKVVKHFLTISATWLGHGPDAHRRRFAASHRLDLWRDHGHRRCGLRRLSRHQGTGPTSPQAAQTSQSRSSATPNLTVCFMSRNYLDPLPTSSIPLVTPTKARDIARSLKSLAD